MLQLIFGRNLISQRIVPAIRVRLILRESVAILTGTVPKAAVTCDRVQAAKIINEAAIGLKGTRYIGLGNPATLSGRQRATLEQPAGTDTQRRRAPITSGWGCRSVIAGIARMGRHDA